MLYFKFNDIQIIYEKYGEMKAGPDFQKCQFLPVFHCTFSNKNGILSNFSKIRKFDSSQINLIELYFFNSSKNNDFTLLIKRITRNYKIISNLFFNVYLIKNNFYTLFLIHFWFFLDIRFFKVLKMRKNLEKILKMKKILSACEISHIFRFYNKIHFYMNFHLKLLLSLDVIKNIF